MDIETIRGEFLRLAADYPDLYHAIVERTDDNFERSDEKTDTERAEQIFTRRGFVVLDTNYFLSSPRARILTLWHGEHGETLSWRAKKDFMRLADLAEMNYRCEQFPLVHEQRTRVRCSVYGIDRETGIGFDDGDTSGSGLDDWIGHVVVMSGVQPDKPVVRGKDDKPLAEYQSHLLPINSFAASAAAMSEPARAFKDDPVDVWAYTRWQYECKKTGPQLFADYENIRADNHWPKVKDWGSLRKRIERYATARDLPLRKGIGGRPLKDIE